MQGHIKGPWYYNVYPYDHPKTTKFEIIPDEDVCEGLQYPIADIHDIDYGCAKANAKLIAAAPLMAQELKESAESLLVIVRDYKNLGAELINSLTNQARSMLEIYQKAVD